MKEKRSCNNCLKGTPMTVNSDILCRDKGVVSPDYVCSKHRYSPVPKTYKDLNFKCVHCENFILNINNSKDTPGLGLCQLFSVRPFNGENKNACSKFIRKTQSEVS
ncbi:MAG: hypothetical protein N3I35_14685 [Clostridia bacterium]|nr:hypothetical protein [Clostridia bacterium]